MLVGARGRVRVAVAVAVSKYLAWRPVSWLCMTGYFVVESGVMFRCSASWVIVNSLREGL